MSPSSTTFPLDTYTFFWAWWIQCTDQEKFLHTCKYPGCTKSALCHLSVLMSCSWGGVQSPMPSTCSLSLLFPTVFSNVSTHSVVLTPCALPRHGMHSCRCQQAPKSASPSLFCHLDCFWHWSVPGSWKMFVQQSHFLWTEKYNAWLFMYP